MNISNYRYNGIVKAKGEYTESSVIIKSKVDVLTIIEIEESKDIEKLLEAYGNYRCKARILQGAGEHEASMIYSNLALIIEERLKILADKVK